MSMFDQLQHLQHQLQQQQQQLQFQQQLQPAAPQEAEGFLSFLFNGDDYVGEVRVRPRTDTAYLPYVFANKAMRISTFSAPSERCQPLSVVHSISTTGLWFVLEAWSPNNGLFDRLFTICNDESKTAMVPMEGGNELHLVAIPSSSAGDGRRCFWGYVAAEGTYASCVSMLSLRCMALVFDLDETLIVANTMRSFEDRIEALNNKLHVEIDPERTATLFAELKRYQDDKNILMQFLETDKVFDNGKVYTVQCETVSSSGQQPLERPIIRLPEHNIILTRINPLVRDTSVLVRLRPAWEDLRDYLTAKGRKRFEVFICTMSEKDYALEMWRLLDPEGRLIPSAQLQERVVCVKAGSKKSLFNVFRTGSCHPRLAMIVDDRLKVWEDADQPRVHVVPPFAPYSAPQAENVGPLPILCIARHVVCNVRGGFFKDFDENLSRTLAAADSRAADASSLPKPLDVADYLTPERVQALMKTPPVEPGRDFPDGMVDSETEVARNPPALQTGPSTTWAAAIPDEIRLQPALVNLLSQLAANKEQQAAAAAAAAIDASTESEEGEVPESELDPDTRRRLLILQHGQDTPRRASSDWDEEDSPRPGSSERGQRKMVDYSEEDHRPNGQADSVSILKSLSQKSKAQLEFKCTVISTSVDLQFCAEVIYNGERIATATGRNRQDARIRASDDAIRVLSGGSETRQQLQNGVQAMQWNAQPPKVAAFNAVAALNDLCTIENLNVVFHDLQLEKHLNPTVYNCEVEISGQVLGRGRGPSWEAARQEASEQALRGMKNKRNTSPRLAGVSKRGRGGRGQGRGGGNGGGRIAPATARRQPAQLAGRLLK